MEFCLLEVSGSKQGEEVAHSWVMKASMEGHSGRVLESAQGEEGVHKILTPRNKK